MDKEPFLVYFINDQGRYPKPTMINGIREAVEYAAQHAAKYPEIRVCDMLDCLVFQIKNGKIVFPQVEVNQVGATVSTQTNARP